jgi:hypothetical protein
MPSRPCVSAWACRWLGHGGGPTSARRNAPYRTDQTRWQRTGCNACFLPCGKIPASTAARRKTGKTQRSSGGDQHRRDATLASAWTRERVRGLCVCARVRPGRTGLGPTGARSLLVLDQSRGGGRRKAVRGKVGDTTANSGGLHQRASSPARGVRTVEEKQTGFLGAKQRPQNDGLVWLCAGERRWLDHIGELRSNTPRYALGWE